MTDVLWRIPIFDKELQSPSGYFVRSTKLSKDQLTALLSEPMVQVQGKPIDPVKALTTSYQNAMDYQDGVRPIMSKMLGYVGSGPVQTRLGDIICIFYGGSTPFIIRDRMMGGHVLVGEAYVHGIMDGELVDRGLPSVTFELW